MKTHYVMVDYESVQPSDLGLLKQDHFKVIIFVGESQSRLSFETAAAMQTLGARAQYIKIKGNGPNALDFHIAFYIGSISSREPGACFYIISKDTGFDPLIQHLKEQTCGSTSGAIVQIQRCTEISGILSSETNSEEQLDIFYKHLKICAKARPGTVKALHNAIATKFQQKMSATEIAAFTELMIKLGWIKIEQTKVTYSLPSRVAMHKRVFPTTFALFMNDPNCAPAE